MAIDFDRSGYHFLQAASDDLVKDIVGQTSGFTLRDLRTLIADAGASLIPSQNIRFDKVDSHNLGEKASLMNKADQDNMPSDNLFRALGKEDLVKALEQSKKRNASALGTPKVKHYN